MTHCKRGHELTPENTRIVRDRGTVYRRCRTCNKETKAAYEKRNRTKAAIARKAWRNAHKEELLAYKRAWSNRNAQSGLCKDCKEPIDFERSRSYCTYHTNKRTDASFNRRGTAPERRRHAVFAHRARFAINELKAQFGERWGEVEGWCTTNIALWLDKYDACLYKTMQLEDYVRFEDVGTLMWSGENETEVEGICQ